MRSELDTPEYQSQLLKEMETIEILLSSFWPHKVQLQINESMGTNGRSAHRPGHSPANGRGYCLLAQVLVRKGANHLENSILTPIEEQVSKVSNQWVLYSGRRHLRQSDCQQAPVARPL